METGNTRMLTRERHIRAITTVLDWRKQRRLWKQLLEEQNVEIVWDK